MKTLSVIGYGFLVYVCFLPVIKSGYCTVKKERTKSYKTRCWSWKWFTCTKYRTIYYYKQECCIGWTGQGCQNAICRGRSDPAACNEYFPNSHIVLADKTIAKKSIGTCIRPDECECKQDGFYSAGSFCDICSPINNCDLEYCTSKTNQKCRRCEGLVQFRPGYRAYIRSTDRRSCKKACSWRFDSRCYPGTCKDELFSTCDCSDGFTGNHCEKITAVPDILYNQVKLTGYNGETVDAPGDFGAASPQPITWTNIMKPKLLYYSFKSSYTQPNPYRPPFVVEYKVGIIDGKIRFTKYGRNGNQIQTNSCSSNNKDNPNQSIFDCRKIIQPTFSVPFQHLERLSFKITSTIGGFVKIKDLEKNVYNTYYYTPNSLSRDFEIKFDNVPPYHCQPVNNCKRTMLTDVDITTKEENMVYWDGWADNDSGIDKYEIELFSMKSVGRELQIGERVFDINITSKSQQLKMKLPGVYSVVLAAVDKAGNIRLARRCLIFEDTNHVSTIYKTNLKSLSALPSTNYTWQQNHGPVVIDWENRYINTKHQSGKYLAGIHNYHGLDREYDDHDGKRTTQPIDNVQGIVRYETYYGIDDQGGSTVQPTNNDFTTTGNLNQSITISPTLQDGDTVKFYIRAYDIVYFYLEESITIYFDKSPPVVDINVTVYEVAGFHHFVIDWIAYDLHSGLETVEWKLYDNFTDDVILYKSQHVPVQGELQTLSDCEVIYKDGYCYCTVLSGCYNKRFKAKAGVSIDKAGVYDYYIEVNAMNNAKLNTAVKYKIPK